MAAVTNPRSAAPCRRAAAAFLLASAVLFGASTTAEAQRRNENQFSHEPHRNVACAACHVSNRTGLGPARVTEQQCQSCHHTGAVGAACTRCHAAAELTRPYQTMQQFRLSVSAQPVARTLILNHQQHGSLQCRDCHNRPPSLSASALSCGSCHEQHHTPDTNCRSCHQPGPGGAHGNAVHLGCGGSECHRAMPVPANTRTRQMCLTCHADRAEHYPAPNCVECHALPAGDRGQAKR